jgi:hypothetical protein
MIRQPKNRPEGDGVGIKAELHRTICFTGERANGKFLVQVCGKDAWLSFAELNLLIRLVLARFSSQLNGFVRVPDNSGRVAIHRLRRAIDRMVGCGNGRMIIENGGKAEYRVAKSLRVALHEGLSAASGVIPRERLTQLERVCDETRL